jgi:arginyl-tRNA synthetase
LYLQQKPFDTSDFGAIIASDMYIRNILKDKISAIVKEVYDVNVDNFVVEHPDNLEHGDYATNVALVLTKIVNQPPLEIAKKIAYELQENPQLESDTIPNQQIFKSVETAPPGFINIFLSEDWLKSVLENLSSDEPYYGTENFHTHSPLKDKRIVVEYTDPNPFKVFHIGHLMTNTIGESLSRLHAACGGNVRSVNYQGDVGMHVSKCLWGLLKKSSEENITLDDMQAMTLDDRVALLGGCYAAGATAFKEDAEAVETMKDLNYIVFTAAQEYLQESKGWTPLVDYAQYLGAIENLDVDKVKAFYKAGRQWSLDYFETIYSRLGTKFAEYYFESAVGEYGYKMVKEQLEKGVFEESDGAVVFRGENVGLHTRVFINSLGLPTYESKDLGLAFLKNEDWPYDTSLIVTANEINEYFKVVLKAMEEIQPELAAKTKHVGHGVMQLSSGKMSSRTGTIVAGDDLLNEVRDVVESRMEEQGVITDSEERRKTADKIAVASIKYNILKQSIGDNIVYDRESALSLTGNTGPYLLYTYARANSVLEKVSAEDATTSDIASYTPQEKELALLRELYKLPEVILDATQKLSPHLLATYIYEIAHKFNAFYADSPIVAAEDASAKEFRILLTRAVSHVLKDTLNMLGIEVVQKM